MNDAHEIVKELERLNTAVEHLQRTLDRNADDLAGRTHRPLNLVRIGYYIAGGFTLWSLVAGLIGWLLWLLILAITGGKVS